MKLHLCAGDIYLKGYENVDIEGYIILPNGVCAVPSPSKCFPFEHTIDLSQGNINETTLDNYFKFPFGLPARPFILDRVSNILEDWQYEDQSVEEIIMISCIEHFNPETELPHILGELNRVIATGGRLIIDWPDIEIQVYRYAGKNDDFLMELIYCNHKNKYSIHHWGFTKNTFPKYLGDNWTYEFKEVVKHYYPMQGCIATKK